MKTPRQAFKENFWIGAKGGLIDQKHVKAMGDSVWLFLYLLRGQTGVNEWGEGVFQYGHPLTIGEIASDFGGVSVRTIQRWILRLRKTGYIATDSHSEKGLTLWIAKAKDKTKKPRTVTGDVTRSDRASKTLASADIADKTPYANRVPSEYQSIREPRTESPHSIRDSVKESLQTAENAPLAAPIPKGFIPKNLSYYNKDAAAKAAAVPVPSLKEILKEKTPPRDKSQADLDARRRELLLQDERLRREHPDWYKNPGNVVKMQPQEATA